MSDYFKHKGVSFADLVKFEKLDVNKLLSVYEYSEVEKRNLVIGYLRECKDDGLVVLDFEIELIKLFIDDGLEDIIIDSLNGKTIKLKVLKCDVMENKLIDTGFVHGEFWFAKDHFFAQKSTYLHCNLRHTLKKGDFFDLKYVAGYCLVAQEEDDVGYSVHDKVWIQDVVQVCDMQIPPKGRTGWLPMVKVDSYPNHEQITIRFCACFYQNIHYFWQIKKV